MKVDLIIRRLGVTIVLTYVLAYLLAIFLPDELVVRFFAVLWGALFLGWPHLSRSLGFPNFPRAPKPRPAAPQRPLWLRLLRRTVIMGLALVVVFELGTLPLTLCHWRAQKAHDTVRVGMTTAEALRSVTGWNFLNASSEFPYADDTKHMHALSFFGPDDRAYHVDGRQLSESEAVALLREKLHDGYRWYFHYTYLNMTPQHVSFTVVVGPDGRVTAVRPVHGWD